MVCAEGRADTPADGESNAAGGNTASGLPLGDTLGSLLDATGGALTDRTDSVLNLDRLLSGVTNTTSLDSLGLGLLNLNVSALVPDASCPGGGLLNADLNLAGICVGAQVLTADNVANLCVLQPGGCCCSPGNHRFHRHWQPNRGSICAYEALCMYTWRFCMSECTLTAFQKR